MRRSCALGDGVVNLLDQRVGGGLRRQGSEGGLRVQRVAGLHGFERRDELGDEVVVDLLGDQDALGGIAGLACVGQPRPGSGFDGGVHVVGVEQDEYVRSAEF